MSIHIKKNLPHFMSLLLVSSQAWSEYTAKQQPVVELLGSGVISTRQGEHSPTWDSTREELVFMRRTPGLFDYTLYSSQWRNGSWTPPEVLPFSGSDRDGGTAFSIDGTSLLFDSRRPHPALAENSINIWQAIRQGDGWSEPQPLLNLSINDRNETPAGQDEFGPILIDEEVWFYSFRAPDRGGSYYRAASGKTPQAVSTLPDPSAATFVAYLTLSADGNTAIMEGRNPSGRDTDLYYACRQAGGWTAAQPLNDINSMQGEGTPYLSSDGSWLFFASDRPTDTDLATGANLYRVSTQHLPIPCTPSI